MRLFEINAIFDASWVFGLKRKDVHCKKFERQTSLIKMQKFYAFEK